MQREILFRGKRIDNGEWVSGFYHSDPEDGEFISCFDSKMCPGNMDEPPYQDIFKISHQVIPETIGQFTGRLIGKIRLFEGDYIRFKQSGLIKIVVFREANNAFCLVNKSDFENESIRRWLGEGIYSNPGENWWREFESDLEIIGNIHDNE